MVESMTLERATRLMKSIPPGFIFHGIYAEALKVVLSEIERLEKESRLFYHADGTASCLASPEDVKARRIAAAQRIHRLIQICKSSGIDVPFDEIFP